MLRLRDKCVWLYRKLLLFFVVKKPYSRMNSFRLAMLKFFAGNGLPIVTLSKWNNNKIPGEQTCSQMCTALQRIIYKCKSYCPTQQPYLFFTSCFYSLLVARDAFLNVDTKEKNRKPTLRSLDVCISYSDRSWWLSQQHDICPGSIHQKKFILSSPKCFFFSTRKALPTFFYLAFIQLSCRKGKCGTLRTREKGK